MVSNTVYGKSKQSTKYKNKMAANRAANQYIHILKTHMHQIILNAMTYLSNQITNLYKTPHVCLLTLYSRVLVYSFILRSNTFAMFASNSAWKVASLTSTLMWCTLTNYNYIWWHSKENLGKVGSVILKGEKAILPFWFWFLKSNPK